LQRADGIFGPLIVHQYETDNVHIDKYDHDLPEHVIVLNDWLHETSINKFAGHHHSDGDNKPNALLINGKGVFKKFTVTNNNLTIELQTPRERFYVEYGKKYRFRVINAGVLYCPIELSIDDHNLTVIASDGRSVEPVDVTSLIIYAGERIDFVLNANQENKTYWIKTKGWADCRVNSAYQTAFLSYEDDTSVLEQNFDYSNATRNGLVSSLLIVFSLLNCKVFITSFILKQLNPWNKYVNNETRQNYIEIDELKAVLDDQTTKFYDKIFNSTVKKYYLAMEFNKVDNGEFHDENLYSFDYTNQTKRALLYTPQINNISLKMPSTPVLYKWDTIPKSQICTHLNKAHVCPEEGKYCSCVYTLEFEVGDVVEFIVVDEGFTFKSNHPMHLHGSSFAVLAVKKLNESVKVSTIQEMDKMGLLERNFDRPPIKDTVTVPVGGNNCCFCITKLLAYVLIVSRIYNYKICSR